MNRWWYLEDLCWKTKTIRKFVEKTKLCNKKKEMGFLANWLIFITDFKNKFLHIVNRLTILFRVGIPEWRAVQYFREKQWPIIIHLSLIKLSMCKMYEICNVLLIFEQIKPMCWVQLRLLLMKTPSTCRRKLN